MARLLHERGYQEVWPLLGGFDGWVELGYPVERHQAGLLKPGPSTGPSRPAGIAEDTTPQGKVDSR